MMYVNHEEVLSNILYQQQVDSLSNRKDSDTTL